MKVVKGCLMAVGGGVVLLIGLIIAIAVFVDTPDSDNTPTPTPRALSSQSTSDPTADVEPTATAIPRTGIQTIQVSVTVQDDWKAWGQGCVGDGAADWVSASNGVAVAPSNSTGTAQGVTLGAGTLSPDETQCQWFASLTSRAADAYVIAFEGKKIVCHSNTMLPTDDGFYAAVIIIDGELQCANVLDVSDAPATPQT